jgi:hypothetical protein
MTNEAMTAAAWRTVRRFGVVAIGTAAATYARMLLARPAGPAPAAGK